MKSKIEETIINYLKENSKRYNLKNFLNNQSILSKFQSLIFLLLDLLIKE